MFTSPPLSLSTMHTVQRIQSANLTASFDRNDINSELLYDDVHRISHFISARLTPWRVFNRLESYIYTVFQKSDAKIEITITTTHVIRIKYPPISFNYHLSGAKVANFNKIHCTVFEQQLFKQVAQLSQRDRAAGWVSNGQKWKTGTERQYLQTI